MPVLIHGVLEHRQFSEEKNGYIPLKAAKCDRCKHAHARVYVIEVNGVRSRVGPTCLLRILQQLPSNERWASGPVECWEEEAGFWARIWRAVRWLFGF